MDINQIFQKIHNLSDSTSLEEILMYENLIFKKIQKEENEILEVSIKFQENIKYQIQKKEKQLDQLQMNYQDTILSYFQKEEIYKFPTQLIDIQNLIQKTNQELDAKHQALLSHKQKRISYLNQVQHIELQTDKTMCLQDKIIFKCDMLVSFWEHKLESLESQAESDNKLAKNNFTTLLQTLEDKIKINVQHQFSRVLEELVSTFQKQITTKNLLQEEKRIISKINPDELDTLQLQNIKIQLKMEHDIFENQKIKLTNQITLLQKDYAKNLQSNNIIQSKYQKKIAVIHSTKREKINNFYEQLEITMSQLKGIERTLICLRKSKSNLIQLINQIEVEREITSRDKFTLATQLKKYKHKKEVMLPNIIKRYNFYMNFYNIDLKETKIKINVLRNNLNSLRQKNILDHPDISVSYQKINILKKLQVYINKQFYDVRT